MLALERSQTFNVFADALNTTFRRLSGRLPEATLLRLDTEAMAAVLYVGGHALLGAAVGAGIASRVPAGGARASFLRAVGLATVLAVVDGFVFGAIWSHRGLSHVVGTTLLVTGALGAVAVAGSAGALAGRLGSGARNLLAVLALAATVVWMGGATVGAVRGPDRPKGVRVDDPARVDTGVKIAIIGLDGVDGRLLERAFAEDRLPNLAALARRGVFADLRSIRPPKSPVVWTSVATGVVPDVHGIKDFVVRREGERVPVTSNLRRVPALWNIAEPAGYSVAFVNWYVTWPAEAVSGTMISDRVDFGGLERRVFPPGLTAAVDSARALVDQRADRDVARFTRIDARDFRDWRATHWGQSRRALGVLDDVVRHDLVTLETARVALRGGQPDLTALYFRGNDNTQHLFWKYRLAEERGDVAGQLYEDLDARNIEALAPVVDRYYAFADAIVGDVVAMLEPDTAILVLSDHGFLLNNERALWWRANGLLEAAGLAELLPGGGVDSSASAVFDPLAPSDTARRVLRPGGTAQDGTLERAREILEAARTDAGDPVFRAASIGEDEQGPRLVVVFDERARGDSTTVAGMTIPRVEYRVPKGKSGDHRMNGVLIAAGGPFRSGVRIDGARALDIAPTVLHALGAPVSSEMEGVPLLDLFVPAWRDAHPVRWIETYGPLEPTDGEVIPTEVDERIREELRALGYLQ